MDLGRIGISTQTPLVSVGSHAAAEAAGGPGLESRPDGHGLMTARMRLEDLHISPGGVSRMVLQTLRVWRARGWLREAHWFSLQPEGPDRLAFDELALGVHHLRLPAPELAAYARTKEKLWADIHGLGAPPFDTEDFRAYARYNASTSDAILERAGGVDGVYVHDFQLMQVGALVGLAAPCVLRWHVPFVPERIPRYTRNFLVRLMEDFDAVIVSTRRDLEGLANAGFRGMARQIYPHTDPKEWHAPSPRARQALEDRLAIPPGDPVVLCVARMDPMKRQDVLLQAFALLRSRHPRAWLVFVGNGSFSGSRGSGLGLSKAEQWRQGLEGMARALRIDGRTVFTGWMPDDLVAAAYARASVLVLPSDLEGFGLTPFEAWSNAKPCIVTEGCGAAEVIHDGLTGHIVRPNDPEGMAAALDRLLASPARAERMGEAGRISLRTFGVEGAAEKEARVLEAAQQRFRRP